MKKFYSVIFAVLACFTALAQTTDLDSLLLHGISVESLPNEVIDNYDLKKKKPINDYSIIGVQYGVGLSRTLLNPEFAKEDFVFIDSPYVPTTANSFTGYTMTGFSQNDHLRLHDYCKQLTNKGAYFLMTNSDTPFVRSYYGGYNMKAIDVARRINRNGGGRKGVDLLITNY